MRQVTQLSRILPVVNGSEVNWPLLILGVGMIAAGLVAPGTHTEVIMALLALGAGLVVAGALASEFRHLEIGLKGVTLNRGDAEAVPVPWLAAEAETLRGIAQLVLGNRELAAQVVEEVVAKIHHYRGAIPRGQRDAATFKALAKELYRIEKRLWFSGTTVADESEGPREVLRALAFPVRVAFVLSLDFSTKEISEIVDRPELDVASDISVATKALEPYRQAPGGFADG